MLANPIRLGQAGQKASEVLVAHNNHDDDSNTMTTASSSDLEDAIGTIARQISNLGDDATISNKLFNYEKESPLDPFGSNFDPKLWVRMMGHVSRESRGERLSGLSYRDLSVHGFGSDAGASDMSYTVIDEG